MKKLIIFFTILLLSVITTTFLFLSYKTNHFFTKLEYINEIKITYEKHFLEGTDTYEFTITKKEEIKKLIDPIFDYTFKKNVTDSLCSIIGNYKIRYSNGLTISIDEDKKSDCIAAAQKNKKNSIIKLPNEYLKNFQEIIENYENTTH